MHYGPNVLYCSQYLLLQCKGFHELRDGTAEAACFSVFFSLATYSIISIIFAIVFILCKNVLGYLFTSRPSVAERVSNLVPFLTTSILLNGIQTVFSGKYLTYPLLMKFFILIKYLFLG